MLSPLLPSRNEVVEVSAMAVIEVTRDSVFKDCRDGDHQGTLDDVLGDIGCCGFVYVRDWYDSRNELHRERHECECTCHEVNPS